MNSSTDLSTIMPPVFCWFGISVHF